MALWEHHGRVPYIPTVTSKAERVTLSNEVLRSFHSIKRHLWQFVITPDKQWFDFSTDHEHI
jgi:hypothetical protein